MKLNLNNESHSGTVLMAEHDESHCALMSQILQKAGHRTVSYRSGEELTAADPPNGPACVLLGTHLPRGMDGSAVQQKLQELAWQTPVIFIAAETDISLTVQVVKAGALDVLAKPVASDLLLESVENALEISQDWIFQHRERSKKEALLDALTLREKEILQWMISGAPNKAIASELGITERTVKAHRTSVKEKLRTVSLVELVRLADECGIAPARLS